MRTITPLRNVPPLVTLPSACSSRQQERNLLVTHLLVFFANGGDAITYLTAHTSPARAFFLLRRLSGLTLVVPQELGRLGLLTEQENEAFLSAGTSRSIKFPKFRDILALSERIHCYLLCRRLKATRLVADQMGWTEKQVRLTREAMVKRLKGVEVLV